MRIDFTTHRTDAMIEDAEFLFSHGVSFAEACRRIGCTESALDKALYRRKERDERHQDAEPDQGADPIGRALSALRAAG